MLAVSLLDVFPWVLGLAFAAFLAAKVLRSKGGDAEPGRSRRAALSRSGVSAAEIDAPAPKTKAKAAATKSRAARVAAAAKPEQAPQLLAVHGYVSDVLPEHYPLPPAATTTSPEAWIKDHGVPPTRRAAQRLLARFGLRLPSRAELEAARTARLLPSLAPASGWLRDDSEQLWTTEGEGGGLRLRFLRLDEAIGQYRLEQRFVVALRPGTT